MWFVYVQGLKGPEAQKWDEGMDFDSTTGTSRETLQKVHLPLNAISEYTIEELTSLYPLKAFEKKTG